MASGTIILGTVMTRDGDTVDRLAIAAYGRTDGTTEALLAANPGLSALGAVLPAGITVTLPVVAATTRSTQTAVRLWD